MVAKQFAQWGYVTLRIDFAAAARAKASMARIICLDQVADTRNALSYLATAPKSIRNESPWSAAASARRLRFSRGGADRRVAAVISCGGWGDGERKFRGQHPTPEAWAKFTNMLEEGKAPSRAHRQVADGAALRYRADPEKLRNRMSSGSIMEFPAETAQSMNDFRADDQVGNISPRPLLLIHSANDSVTPTV